MRKVVKNRRIGCFCLVFPNLLLRHKIQRIHSLFESSQVRISTQHHVKLKMLKIVLIVAISDAQFGLITKVVKNKRIDCLLGVFYIHIILRHNMHRICLLLGSWQVWISTQHRVIIKDVHDFMRRVVKNQRIGCLLGGTLFCDIKSKSKGNVLAQNRRNALPCTFCWKIEEIM